MFESFRKGSLHPNHMGREIVYSSPVQRVIVKASAKSSDAIQSKVFRKSLVRDLPRRVSNRRCVTIQSLDPLSIMASPFSVRRIRRIRLSDESVI